jgi:transcriptional regulator with XRE-family HTH domain
LVHFRIKCPRRKDYSENPETLGQHIKKRRHALGLSQSQAALRLGVSAATILNWERGKRVPLPRMLGSVIPFLGYDPFPEPATLSERLLRERQKRGWSIREAARDLGIDPGTWGDWERGELILFLSHRTKVATLLRLDPQQMADEMRARWNGKHRR